MAGSAGPAAPAGRSGVHERARPQAQRAEPAREPGTTGAGRESAAAGIWVLDRVTGVFWTNARARAIFGYSPDEIVTTDRVLARSDPEDRDRVRGAIERSRDTTEFVDLLYRIVLPEDGRVRWISSRGRLQRGSAGEPERLTGLSIDVTTQRAAEEAFRVALEEVNRATFEQAAVGIAHVGTDGRWLRSTTSSAPSSAIPAKSCCA